MPRSRGYVGANHRSVKRSNRALIFKAIHSLGPLARVDLAKQTGLNPATVSNIVDELIESGLAGEIGERSTQRAGRRPVQLEVNPTARYAVGVDLAMSATTVALVDLAGQPRKSTVQSTTGPWRDDLAVPAAVEMTERLLSELTSSERESVVGLGIGAPSPTLFDRWNDLDLCTLFEQRVQLPTYADNNGNTSALAELWFGAGQNVSNFVLLTLSTGVGAGLVLDGDLYRGGHKFAGEAGHIGVDLDGPRCTCGNFGCLEMYAAVPRVLSSIRAALDTGEPSAIRDATASGQELTIAAVIGALQNGDALAVRVFADVARHLAAGIVSIMNTVDPELVLIGRELASAGEALLEPVRIEVRRRAMPQLRDTVRIEIASLKEAPVIGAATLALREFFQAPLSQPQLVATR